MTPQRMIDAAQILGELGNGKMANELRRFAYRHRWRQISELHEDYGMCVLMNIDDLGYFGIGSNTNIDYNESLWTHFAPILELGQEEYERLRAEVSERESKDV